MKAGVHRLLLVLVPALCCVSAHASTISYSDSGTFTASTPSSTFSGPNETWAFGFQANSNPVVLEFGNGGFDFAFSDFSYSLNGSPVAITPTFIRFFTAANGGGFAICFSGTTVASCTNGLGTGFSPTQMFIGTTSAPTLLAGAFTFDQFGFVVGSTSYGQPTTTVQATATPEPSAFLLALTGGLLALGGRRLCRQRQHP
jgi:hypothetical protein